MNKEKNVFKVKKNTQNEKIQLATVQCCKNVRKFIQAFLDLRC